MTFPTNQVWIPLSTAVEEHHDKANIIQGITLIIPTLGRAILETCLAYVVSGTRRPQVLIIVHQGNEPEIEYWAQQLQQVGIQSIYLQMAERGKPRAINLAFANTTTRFVCMIDDDCFVDPHWLENMANCLDDHPDWIITGRVDPGGEESIAIVQGMDPVVYSRPRVKSDLFVGGNFGASLDTIRRVGPFDEDPLLRSAAEDVEWGYRALKTGVSIAYAPDVAVTHYGWRAEQERYERFRVYAHGHGGFYGKYLRRGDLFILLRAAIHFGRAFRRWMRGWLTGNAELAMNGKAYCLGLLPGIVAGFRSPVHLQKIQ